MFKFQLNPGFIYEQVLRLISQNSLLLDDKNRWVHVMVTGSSPLPFIVEADPDRDRGGTVRLHTVYLCPRVGMALQPVDNLESMLQGQSGDTYPISVAFARGDLTKGNGNHPLSGIPTLFIHHHTIFQVSPVFTSETVLAVLKKLGVLDPSKLTGRYVYHLPKTSSTPTAGQ